MKPDTVLPAEDPMYPSSDGLPLAENDWQKAARRVAEACIAELEARLREP